MINKEKFEDFDKKILDQIEPKIKKVSEMSYSERQFLNGIIRKERPKKIVEIGVAAGASSAVILNAIKDMGDSRLYSLDYSTLYYRNNNKKTGFIVEEFPELSGKWTLKTGGMACNFLDEIGGEIDMCLLDTMHSNPGEFLDYLQILPYMKKNGIVVIHDNTLHTFTENKLCTCCTLLSAINGKKILPQRTERPFFPNISAVVLDDNATERVFDIFHCLALPWDYMLDKKDINILKKHFSKYYKKEYVNWFLKSCEYNKQQIEGKVNKTVEPAILNDRFKKIKRTINMYAKNNL